MHLAARTKTGPPSSARAFEILLIDDDDDDVRLAEKALENDRFHSRLHRVEDGVQAIAFLERQGPYSAAPRPDLILLDLNMPRVDGDQVLRRVKQHASWKTIPVVVLTSSDDQADIVSSYTHHANSCVTKPIDLPEYRSVLAALQEYWFAVVAMPRPSS